MSSDGPGSESMTPTASAAMVNLDSRRRSSLIPGLGSASGQEEQTEGDFTMGVVLGEGLHGIVVSCKHIATGAELAIKMVDKVTTALVDILEEAKIMLNLTHPNIVKFHDIFDEQFFACIVMDLYKGGSLIDLMGRHIKEKQNTPKASAVIHVLRQMPEPLKYLHDSCILHRDVTADNFLADRGDILDPECIVVLADFGSARQFESGQAVPGQVGRKLFWAPEVVSTKEATVKTDVWALGVTFFGLLDGRFPFSSEMDAVKNEPDVRFEMHPAGRDMILAMLEKDPANRLAASDVLAHPWLVMNHAEDDEERAPRTSFLGEAGGARKPAFKKKPTFKRGRSDDDVSSRRRVLLERILSVASVPGKKKHDGGAQAIRRKRQVFSITNKANQRTTKYAWWTIEKATKAGLLNIGPPASELDDRWHHTVSMMLQQHGIDMAKVRKTQLQDLSAEVSSGAARLMFDATAFQKLVRVVEFVEVCVRVSPGKVGAIKDPLILSMRSGFEKVYDDESVSFPAAVCQPHEHVKETALRILRDQLGLGEEAIRVSTSTPSYKETEEVSAAFDMLPTIRCRSVVDCELVAQEAGVLTRLGLLNREPWSWKDSVGEVRHFGWVDALEAGTLAGAPGCPSAATSRLVPAPCGPTLAQLKRHMKRKGVDISPTTHKSLEDLFAETRKGDAALMLDPTGDITHVIDVVMIQVVHKASCTVLVETERVSADGVKEKEARLPSARRRADENHFFTVWRILGEQLALEAEMVAVDPGDVRCFEEEKESSRFPGLRTLFRKRLMKGMLQEPTAK